MKKRLWVLICLSIMVISLAGCSSSDKGGGGIAPPAGGDSTTVSGVASKGLVKGGTVSLYAIVDGQKEDLLGTDTTEEDGSYEIETDHTGPVLVEVTGGTYLDEASGEDVTLTTPLRAVVADARDKISVAITPLTELAARRAEKAGLTQSAITAANAMVSQMLGSGGDILTAQPFKFEKGAIHFIGLNHNRTGAYVDRDDLPNEQGPLSTA